MGELSKALRKQLALSGATIVRIDRAVVGMIAEDIEQLESELSRLREAIHEVCTDYESRGVAENSTYYKILRDALKEGK